jgi:hypothetical protein
LAFAAENWIESSGVGSWQITVESRELVEDWQFSYEELGWEKKTLCVL